MSSKTVEDKQVLVRLPATLVKSLDREAKKQQRPRSAVIRLRLAHSIKVAPDGVQV
jgi:predicted transcriptional regulator